MRLGRGKSTMDFNFVGIIDSSLVQYPSKYREDTMNVVRDVPTT